MTLIPTPAVSFPLQAEPVAPAQQAVPRVPPLTAVRGPETSPPPAAQPRSGRLQEGHAASPDLALDAALDELNQSMRAWSTQLAFEIDTSTRQVAVSVIDTATGEVIKKIPAESIIKAAKLIAEQANTSGDLTAQA